MGAHTRPAPLQPAAETWRTEVLSTVIRVVDAEGNDLFRVGEISLETRRIADLAAAAPEMLAALRDLHDHAEFYVGHYHPNGKRELPRLLKAADEAINKAAAPRCGKCGRAYARQEAKAGFKNCEHCGEDKP